MPESYQKWIVEKFDSSRVWHSGCLRGANLAKLPTIFRFGRGDAGTAFLDYGWSAPEAGYTWSIGNRSRLRLPLPAGVGDVRIDLTTRPFTAGEAFPSQRLILSVDKKQHISEVLRWERCLGLRIDEHSVGNRTTIDIEIHCPDATGPADLGVGDDRRQLGVALRDAYLWRDRKVRPFYRQTRGPIHPPHNGQNKIDAAVFAVTQLTISDLANRFESLGRHCEFGLVQRMCSCEPLSLLRFAGLPYRCLLHGLRNGFAEIDATPDVEVKVDEGGGEWMVVNHRYEMSYHTFISPKQIDAASLLDQQRRALRFKRDKLREMLATGEKLFVVRDPQGITEASARPLLNILQGYGPNYLLFVSDQTGHPPGTVEALSPHLFMGSLDGITIGADEREIVGRATWLSDAAMSAWLSICAHTYRLWREDGGGCN
jgi:hypothetical protein